MEKCIYHTVTPAKSLQIRLNLANRKSACCFHVCDLGDLVNILCVSFKIATVHVYVFYFIFSDTNILWKLSRVLYLSNYEVLSKKSDCINACYFFK